MCPFAILTVKENKTIFWHKIRIININQIFKKKLDTEEVNKSNDVQINNLLSPEGCVGFAIQSQFII